MEVDRPDDQWRKREVWIQTYKTRVHIERRRATNHSRAISKPGHGHSVQVTTRDLGTKKWIFTADAARNGRDFTPFHVQTV